MNEENFHNQTNSTENELHSPMDQVKCLLCQNIPDQYISLDCKDDFCLQCLAQKYFEIRTSSEITHKDNNFEICCPICNSPTLLDEVSINALEETLNLMRNESKTKDLFNEIIMEDSAENYNYEESLKIEEKKSHDTKNYNNNSHFLSPNNLKSSLEENKEKVDDFPQFEFEISKPPKEKNDKNPPKQKKNLIDSIKIQEKDFKKEIPTNKIATETHNEKKEKKCFEEQNIIYDPYYKNKEPKCPKHKNESINLFCFTCETSCLCVECLVEGTHKNHNVKNISKGSQLFIEKIVKMNEKISQKHYRNKDLLNFLKDERKIVQELVNSNIEALSTKFKEIIQKIQQKEQEISREYQRQGIEKIEKIDNLINVIEKNKEILANIQSPNIFEKLPLITQVNYYNNYAENRQKLSRFLDKRFSFSTEQKSNEISFQNDLNSLNFLLKSIENLNAIPRKSEPSELIENNYFNRKLRMESEYLQDFQFPTENVKNNTQCSSFLGSLHEYKLPQRKIETNWRNPFKNKIFNSNGDNIEKNSKLSRFKELKLSNNDVFRTSTKGWSKTPTHSNENILERQQKKFEKQKEFFFIKY